jgi:hypothetical protein
MVYPFGNNGNALGHARAQPVHAYQCVILGNLSCYLATGGWFIVQVGGSTLGVMGQVIDADGTGNQYLALVNNTTQAQVGDNVQLPAGTILIAPDATNNAIVAEYPDTTGNSPITRFARLYPNIGTGKPPNLVPLTATSPLVPAVGFLVTQNDTLATFVLGQANFQPNQ